MFSFLNQECKASWIIRLVFPLPESWQNLPLDLHSVTSEGILRFRFDFCICSDCSHTSAHLHADTLLGKSAVLFAFNYRDCRIHILTKIQKNFILNATNCVSISSLFVLYINFVCKNINKKTIRAIESRSSQIFLYCKGKSSFSLD